MEETLKERKSVRKKVVTLPFVDNKTKYNNHSNQSGMNS